MEYKNMTHAAQNSALNVLCRLSAEVAYVQKRLCIRNADVSVRLALGEMVQKLEDAIKLQQGFEEE
ncbi:MAG: hypothetical protein WC130_03675 [Kiritimatiellia bacterium]